MIFKQSLCLAEGEIDGNLESRGPMPRVDAEALCRSMENNTRVTKPFTVRLSTQQALVVYALEWVGGEVSDLFLSHDTAQAKAHDLMESTDEECRVISMVVQDTLGSIYDDI